MRSHRLLGSRVATSVGFISYVYSVNYLTVSAARGDGTGGKASFASLPKTIGIDMLCSPSTVRSSPMRTCELHHRLYKIPS